MKWKRTTHAAITLAALIAVGIHVGYPALKFDTATLTLLVIAALPWLGSVFKSVELPGGLKVEYQELEKATREADKAGLLAAPEEGRRGMAPDIAIAEEDPNLLLAGLRIEIEKRLRKIAASQGMEVERQGADQLLRRLTSAKAISPEERAVLSELIRLLNSAVHGAEVDPRAARWAIDFGPRFLAALDQRMNQ